MHKITMEDIDKHISLRKYKDTMKELVKLYYPHISEQEMDYALDYSIVKRYNEFNVKVTNNYSNKEQDMTLLELTDYINSRQPIVTAAGVLFSRHGDKPNPLIKVIQKFLDLRSEYKKKMFSYPKGSEEYEHYNLMQSLKARDTIYASMWLKLS